MRTDIVHSGAGELTYEIRNIVSVGEKIEEFGGKTYWENIGDPIAKGEEIPQWMKQIVAELVMQDCSYGYCPTRGDIVGPEIYLPADQRSRQGADHP